jgi:hypothetical protein
LIAPYIPKFSNHGRDAILIAKTDAISIPLYDPKYSHHGIDAILIAPFLSPPNLIFELLFDTTHS